MTHVRIQPGGTVRLPVKVLRAAQLHPGDRVAVSAGTGRLSLVIDRGGAASAYAAYYRSEPAGVRREQLEIEADFAAADNELIERIDAPRTTAPGRRVHRPARPNGRRRNP